MIDTKKLRCLSLAATPGPWKRIEFRGKLPSVGNANGQHISEHCNARDADLIVGMRNSIDELLDERAKLIEVLKAARLVNELERSPGSGLNDVLKDCEGIE